MRSEELMQNDWVQLEANLPIYCKVRAITASGHIMGETSSGGHFEQKASRFVPIELVQDTILCTTFWLKKKDIFITGLL